MAFPWKRWRKPALVFLALTVAGTGAYYGLRKFKQKQVRAAFTEWINWLGKSTEPKEVLTLDGGFGSDEVILDPARLSILFRSPNGHSLSASVLVEPSLTDVRITEVEFFCLGLEQWKLENLTPKQMAVLLTTPAKGRTILVPLPAFRSGGMIDLRRFFPEIFGKAETEFPSPLEAVLDSPPLRDFDRLKAELHVETLKKIYWESGNAIILAGQAMEARFPGPALAARATDATEAYNQELARRQAEICIHFGITEPERQEIIRHSSTRRWPVSRGSQAR